MKPTLILRPVLLLALLIAPALARFGSDEPTQGFGNTKLSAAPGIPFL